MRKGEATNYEYKNQTWASLGQNKEDGAVQALRTRSQTYNTVEISNNTSHSFEVHEGARLHY